MDVNLTLVSGRLALAPEIELLMDGSQRVKLLVCVRSERRSRFDVLPVIVPPEIQSNVLRAAPGGSEVFVAGPLMRRCSPEAWEPSGNLEIVASAISFPDLEDMERPGGRM